MSAFWQSRRNRILTIAAAFLLCVALMAVAWIESPWRGLPYHDAFASGDAGAWVAYAGNWTFVKDAIKNDSDERGAKLVMGSSHWKSYEVKSEVQLLGAGDAGIMLRSSDIERGVDSYNGYYAGLRTNDQSLVLGRAQHGWFEFPPASMPGGVIPGQWYRLRIAAQRCTISASAVAIATGLEAHIRINDPDCLQEGKVGLRSMGAGGMWRDVAISRLPAQVKDNEPPAFTPEHVALYPTSQGSTVAVPALEQTPSVDRKLPPARAIQSIRNLRMFSITKPAHAVVRGSVILTNPAVYIQDSSGGVRVEATQPASLRIGDEVEVEGDVFPRGLSATIRHAVEQPLGGGFAPLPPPLSVTADQAATGTYDSRFIEVEGGLVEKSKSAGGVTLEFRNGLQTFRAIANSAVTSSLFEELKIETVVRLRGVCMVSPDFTNNTVPFALIVNSPEDIKIVSGPPWWSPDHILLLAVAMSGIGFLVHLFFSRAEQWRFHAVLKERERLAHEMHDTLAQSFAGIGFQLRAIRNRLSRNRTTINVDSVLEDLTVASELVRHSHDEARRTIAILRPEALEATGLVSALEQSARRIVARGSVTVEASYTGEARTLPLRILDSLFRIGQEAFANAIQHGHPKKITIILHYETSSVTLIIQDDGAGFLLTPQLNGFGITGMRRRAEAIHATLEIDSEPGKGARVSVTASTPTVPWWRRLAYSRGVKKEKRQNGS